MTARGGSHYNRPMDSDRRRHRRYVLQTEVAVLVGPQKTRKRGKLLDLSVGGAFLAAPVQAEVGSGVFVSFIYWGNHLCEATGHVVRILPFGQELGMAIEFGFINEGLGAFLRAYERTAEALRPELLDALTEFQIRLP